MAESDLGIIVTLKGDKELLKKLRSMPERLGLLVNAIPYLGTDFIHKFVTSRLPQGPDYAAYRRSLRVGKVQGLNPKIGVWAVYCDPMKATKLNGKPETTLIYVDRPKESTASLSPIIPILKQYGPWTHFTLPYTPTKTEGSMVFVKAPTEAVKRVMAQNEKQRVAWEKALRKAQKRVKATDTNASKKMAPGTQTLSDVERIGIETELGLGVRQPKPLFRIGVQTFMMSNLKTLMARNPVLVKILTSDAGDAVHFPPGGTGKLTIVQAMRFKPFQKVVLGG